MYYTVCIVNDTIDSPMTAHNLNKLLTQLHAAMCKLHADSSLYVLYSPTTTNTTTSTAAFITHHPDPEKFAKKARDALAGCTPLSDTVLVEAVRKMVAVWRRKSERVVVSLVSVGECLGGVDVTGGDGVCIGHVHVEYGRLPEYLCQKYHLRPVVVDQELVGLLRMPWLEVPATDTRFADRQLSLHRLNPNSHQLLIASHKLPIVMVSEQLLTDHQKFMDGEGRVYEYVDGYMYRRLSDTNALGDSYAVGDCVEMVMEAHLLHNSILLLTPPNLFMHNQLQSYDPILFNPKYPLLQQLSAVLRSAAATTTLSTKAESDMLSHLLHAISAYHLAASPDLFHIGSDGDGGGEGVMALYGKLRRELEVVAKVAGGGVRVAIAGAYEQVDTDTRVKRQRQEQRPGCVSYLTVQKGDRPKLPPLSSLLTRYYHTFITGTEYLD